MSDSRRGGFFCPYRTDQRILKPPNMGDSLAMSQIGDRSRDSLDDWMARADILLGWAADDYDERCAPKLPVITAGLAQSPATERDTA